MTYTYRICSKCRKVVNVSSKEKHGKRYICPVEPANRGL